MKVVLYEMMKRKWSKIRQRMGLSLQRERSILFVGSISSYQAALPLIEWIEGSFQRIRIVLAGDESVVRWFDSSVGPGVVHLLPYPFSITMGYFLKTVSPRCVIFLDEVQHSSELLAKAKRDGFPAIRIQMMSPSGPQTDEALSYHENIDVDLKGNLESSHFAEVLKGALASEFRPFRVRSGFSLPRIVLAATRSRRLRPLLKWRLWRLADLSELSEAIGYPKTIMCLGNGPSSEDLSLENLPSDALFRVNYSWASRKKFCNPDVIFTGSGNAIASGGKAVIATQNLDGELRVIRRRAFSLRRRVKFAQVNELAPSLATFSWEGLWPTNGAAMIAVATALQPQKLIIAGVDLFRDSRGAYPGDEVTPNTYTPKHSVELELKFILHCLDNYRGEIVIVSHVLRQEWLRYVEARSKNAV